MIMAPRVRKLSLTAHVTSSVGWLGAVAVFLALSVAGLTSRDEQVVRAAYIAMDWAAWFILVPLALASLLTGIVQSLGTTWGLFRNYWVLIKLVLTVLATGVLLLYTQTLSYLAGVAADPALTGGNLGGLRSPSPLLHASAALAVLLAVVTLSVFKPRGMTRYGQRKQQARRARS